MQTNKVMVDSSVWIDFLSIKSSELKSKTKANYDDLAYFLILLYDKKMRVFLPDLILSEILSGYDSGGKYSQINLMLEYLESGRFEFMNIMGNDSVIAKSAAAMRRELRTKGSTVRGLVDAIIGAWCIQNNTMLITKDKTDFEPMAKHLGLMLYGYVRKERQILTRAKAKKPK